MTQQTMLDNVPTATPTASTIANWDANKNLSANSMIEGYTTTATAATTTTLLVGSTYAQYFTGTTTQTVLLPVTSTLALGQSFYIVNNSSGVVTVQSSGANTIQAMAASTTLLLTCISTSGTGTSSWNSQYLGSSSAGGTVNSGTQYDLSYYATSTNAVSPLATTNNGILVTNGSGSPSISTTTPSGLTIPQPLIEGFTNGSAASSGNVGEIISSVISSGSAVTLNSNSIANITSITLSAGRWIVWGNVYMTCSGLNMSASLCWISLTSVTQPDGSLIAESNTAGASVWGGTVVPQPFNVSTNTTIYLSALAVLYTGSATGSGGLYALRTS